uniref:Uncharacterized protein n=1 Tax=Meloidogyne enterolobii TaxID=390850 RepID=A0A6V7Y9L6_MELEN|nr:unnamed protein product [Meloidogyne enterolobii]
MAKCLKAVMRGEQLTVNVKTNIFSKVVEWMGELDKPDSRIKTNESTQNGKPYTFY